MSVRTADYDYELPEDLIALYPAARRDQSRMMLLDRREQRVTHLHFTELVDQVDARDVLVLNDTKVVPARIRLQDRNAELLVLERVDSLTWRCLVRPGRWFKQGRIFSIQGVTGKVVELLDEGDRLVRFDAPFDLETLGEIALPPYIDRSQEPIDRERYQTIYASKLGAIAAPTAGLHFTSTVLDRLPHEFITLHVGAGTFRSVKTELVSEHRMHLEEFEVSQPAAANINGAKKILAVGTTTVRAIESLMRQFGEIRAGKHRTDIFIYPPFGFRRVDSLLTNFHLPKSTLLMLVAAFAGREFVLEAYREAIRERYRFFSYGDCMLIR
jgi:S-adenosylmethionine:tRNA ribosyltransferase-isomerase